MRLIATFLLLLAPLWGFSEEKIEVDKNASEIIFLPSSTVHEGNYYAMGSTVSLSGEILGDAYILASQAFIEGTVHGDVIIACGSVQITGKVLGDVRALGGQVTVSGQVEKNMTLLTGDFQLDKGSEINGNVLCLAGNADFRGSVGSTLKVLASNLRLSGVFKGPIDALVGKMHVTSAAHLESSLDYQSSAPALLDPETQIAGPVVYHPSFFERNFKQKWFNRLVLGSQILGLMMNFFFCILIAFVFKKLYPRQFDEMVENAKRKPGSSLLYGLILVIGLPILCLALLLTVLGAPFAIALVGLNVIGFYSAKIFSVLAVSEVICKKVDLQTKRMLLLPIGLIIYFMITQLPFVGGFFAFVMMLIGIGASLVTYSPPKKDFFHFLKR